MLILCQIIEGYENLSQIYLCKLKARIIILNLNFHFKQELMLLLLLSLVFTVNALESRKCYAVDYSFSVLSLTWPPQFCTELEEGGRNCVYNWQKIWDGSSMLIHGFWPGSTNLAYLSCFKQYGYDPNCYGQLSFKKSLFSNTELQQLNQHWPSLGPMKNFWEYQWDKHGTCYLKLINDFGKSRLSNDQIQHQYFMNIVKFKKSLNIKLSPGKVVSSKQQFAQIIRLKPSQFFITCSSDNQLKELRICYEIKPNPGEEKIKDCPKMTDPSICKFPMTIIKYGKRSLNQASPQNPENEAKQNYGQIITNLKTAFLIGWIMIVFILNN